MRKRYVGPSSLAIFVFAFFIFGTSVHAQDSVRFNRFIDGIRAHRAHLEAQLGLIPQADIATSYYDDLEAHYEQVWMVEDMIDESLR